MPQRHDREDGEPFMQDLSPRKTQNTGLYKNRVQLITTKAFLTLLNAKPYRYSTVTCSQKGEAFGYSCTLHFILFQFCRVAEVTFVHYKTHFGVFFAWNLSDIKTV